MKILEVDQWTSTGNVTDFTMAQWESGEAFSKISGGDSRAIKLIYGGDCRIREVSENDYPRMGVVWFRENEQGKLVQYKCNYDTSG